MEGRSSWMRDMVWIISRLHAVGMACGGRGRRADSAGCRRAGALVTAGACAACAGRARLQLCEPGSRRMRKQQQKQQLHRNDQARAPHLLNGAAHQLAGRKAQRWPHTLAACSGGMRIPVRFRGSLAAWRAHILLPQALAARSVLQPSHWASMQHVHPSIRRSAPTPAPTR